MIGLLLGVWLALRLRGGSRSLAAVVGYSGLTLGTVVAGAAAVIALVLLFDETLNRNAAKPQALFEIRLPPGSKLADDRRGIEVELNTDRNGASAFLHEEWRHDGNRPVISGGVELAFRTTQRILVLKIKGEPDRLFRLELSGKPVHSDEFGAWQPVDFVADGPIEPRPATAADQFDIRYRSRDPNVEFSRPIIAFELSLPAATGLPTDLESIAVEAQEAQNTMEGAIHADSIKRENGRVTLAGTVQLGRRHALAPGHHVARSADTALRGDTAAADLDHRNHPARDDIARRRPADLWPLATRRTRSARWDRSRHVRQDPRMTHSFATCCAERSRDAGGLGTSRPSAQ